MEKSSALWALHYQEKSLLYFFYDNQGEQRRSTKETWAVAETQDISFLSPWRIFTRAEAGGRQAAAVVAPQQNQRKPNLLPSLSTNFISNSGNADGFAGGKALGELLWFYKKDQCKHFLFCSFVFC